MVKITLKIDGMMCGMCESHVNNAIRNAATVTKVTSSHSKGETVIIADNDVEEQVLIDAVKGEGYNVTSVQKQPYEKKGLFSFFKKK